MISLSVPAIMAYRDLVTRAVATACKIASQVALDPQASEEGEALVNEMVSAVGEAFNNVVLHGYKGLEVGKVTFDIEVTADELVIAISDHGKSFDIDAVPEPDLDQLPESGMGLFIIRSFVDELVYEPGKPNVLRMSKKLRRDR